MVKVDLSTFPARYVYSFHKKTIVHFDMKTKVFSLTLDYLKALVRNFNISFQLSDQQQILISLTDYDPR